MRLVLSLFALGVLAQDNPDVPPRFRGLINSVDYHQLRDQHVNLMRGLPADPKLRDMAVAAWKVQRQQLRTNAQAAGLTPPLWRAIGPAPVPNGPVSGSLPVSGRATAIEVHPTNPNLVYLGTAQGGVYRSTNGGANWTPLFDSAATSAIGALKIDPNNPARLWIGTGEANGSLDSYAGVGVYRCDSCDTAPVLVGPIAAFKGRSISSLLVAPGNSNTVFVGVAGGVMGIGGESPFGGAIPPLPLRGLYRLTNAGGALASIGVERLKVSTAGGCFDNPCTGNRNVDSMVFDPVDSTGNTLLVWQNGGSSAGDGGVWRSTNALAPASTVAFTQTFATTSTSSGNGRGLLSIYRPASGPSVVYIASGEPATGTSCVNTSQNAGAVRKSIDGGLTFSSKLAASGGFCGGQCFYNLGLEVVPGATPGADKVFIGGQTSSSTCSRINAISNDGGNSFFNFDTGLHADTHAIRVAPSNPQIVYHANDGGIFKSMDGGATWMSLNNSDINSVQFSGLAVHPSDVKFSLGGSQDNGTHLRRSDGTWQRVDFGDGGYTLVDQNAADGTNVTMYHTYFNASSVLLAYARVDSVNAAFDGNWDVFGCGSANPGNNGINCSDVVLFYAPMALGPGNPNTVYYGSDRLYRSNSKGATHTVASQAPIAAGTPISTIAISPRDDNYRMVGLSNGQIWFTTTGSATLTRLGASAFPAKYAGRVRFDPNNKNTAYVAFGGYMGDATAHVWKVTNLASVTPVITAAGSGLPDVPVNTLVVDPADSNTVFAGTDIGVYVSNDAGASWAPFGDGLPVVAVFGMEIQPTGRLLRIATHGRGMWEASVGAVATPADMTITKSHTGNFSPGQTGATYTLTVRNVGTGPTTDTVGVSDVVPAGLTATSIGGSGWNCTQPAGPCSRGDVLAAGASYPPLLMVVNVAANAASSVTNCATVTGGGQTNVANDTSCDVTSIVSNQPMIILPTSVTMNPGETIIFPITLSVAAPLNGLFISMSSSDTAVAALSAPFVVIDTGGTSSTRVRLTALTNGQVTITASGPGYLTGSVTLRIGTGGAPVAISTTTLPTGVANALYSASLLATGGTPPYTWSVTSGNLPSGLTLNPSGLLSGTPTAAASIGLGVRVTDSSLPAQTANALLLLTISAGSGAAASVVATGGTPQSAVVNTTFTLPLSATVRDANGAPVAGLPVVFTAPVSGAGAVFDGSGIVATVVTNASGVALSPLVIANGSTGTYSVVASVSGISSMAVFTLTNTGVAVGPALSLPSLVTLAIGEQTALTLTLPASAPSGGVYVTLENNNPAVASLSTATMFIPEGQLNTTRARLTGLANGVAVVKATALGYAPAQAEVRVGNPAAAPLSIVTTALPDGRVGSAYQAPLVASGGVPPYVWALTGGTLPGGLSLTGAGVMSGLPAAAGTTTLTFRVTDGSSPQQTATVTLPVTIQSAPVGPVLQLPGTIEVPVGGSALLPITLSTAAPADGLFITITNDNGSVLTVSAPFTVMSPGQTSSNRVRLTGVTRGSALVTVTAAGYASATTRVNVN